MMYRYEWVTTIMMQPLASWSRFQTWWWTAGARSRRIVRTLGRSGTVWSGWSKAWRPTSWIRWSTCSRNTQTTSRSNLSSSSSKIMFITSTPQDQCDQIRLFLKGLGNQFSYKTRASNSEVCLAADNNPNTSELLGYCKNCSDFFGGQLLEKLGYFLFKHPVSLPRIIRDTNVW